MCHTTCEAPSLRCRYALVTLPWKSWQPCLCTLPAIVALPIRLGCFYKNFFSYENFHSPYQNINNYHMLVALILMHYKLHPLQSSHVSCTLCMLAKIASCMHVQLQLLPWPRGWSPPIIGSKKTVHVMLIQSYIYMHHVVMHHVVM